MSSTARSITAHLLSIPTHPTYLSATKSHSFLASAANSTLSNDRLSFWLYQDYIYAAHAYPRFIASLISHIPFDQPHPCADQSQTILRILVGCLENIMLEIEFFKNTAKKWALDLEIWRERKETRDYTAEMARVAATGHIEEGLLFLWAMEKVYLDAWTNILAARSQGSEHPKESPVLSFATNWSTAEFERFVDNLAVLVDDMYKGLGNDEWKYAEGIWRRVVELEEKFWPREGEEVDLPSRNVITA